MAKGLQQRQSLRNKRIAAYKSNRQKIRHILEYGVLAPSTHNTQPWKFQINGDQVKVLADFTKKIPEADPTGRDLYMSIGALVKNIELASQAYGVNLKVEIQAQLKDQEYVATLTFNNLSEAEDPEYSSILNALITRQNYRGVFKPDIDKAKIQKILETVLNPNVSAQAVFDKEALQDLALLTAEGLKMGYANPSFRQEISSYINHNLSRKRYGLHGYSLRMNLPTSVIVPRVMKRKDIGPKLADLNYKSFMSAPGVIILSAEDNEKSWFDTGQVLEETNIRLAQIGLTSSIYAAAIEMGELRLQVARHTSVPKKRRPQLLFCIGAAASPLPYSVRKKLRSVIVR